MPACGTHNRCLGVRDQSQCPVSLFAESVLVRRDRSSAATGFPDPMTIVSPRLLPTRSCGGSLLRPDLVVFDGESFTSAIRDCLKAAKVFPDMRKPFQHSPLAFYR